MSSNHDDDRDDGPALPERDVLDAWRVPRPAPDLTDRVLAHVEAALPLGTVAALPAPQPRRGLGLAVVGVSMLAAAALVLGVAQTWRRAPVIEAAPAVVAAPASEVAPAPPRIAGLAPAGTELAPAGADPAPTSAELAPAGAQPAPAGVDPATPGDAEPALVAPTREDPTTSRATERAAAPNDRRAPERAPATRVSDRDDRSRPSRAAAPGAKKPSDPDDPAKTVTMRIGVAQGLPWATVFIDGERIGPTPLMAVKVTPGVHEVRWEWSDGRSVALTVEASAGTTLSLKSPVPKAPSPTP